MLADKVNTKSKRSKVWNKEHIRNYERKRMNFLSLARIYDSINLTGKSHYTRYITDPYAVLLLLGLPKNIELPLGVKNQHQIDDVERSWDCKRVYEALMAKGTEEEIFEAHKELIENMGPLEFVYLKEIAQNRRPQNISTKTVLRELTKDREIEFEELYYVWVLQPDPEAIAFMVTSGYVGRQPPRTLGNQRVTPLAGRPIRFMPVGDRKRDVFFPCLVQPFYEGKRIQIHKTTEDTWFFDEDGRSLIIPELEERVGKYSHNGVIDGIIKNDGEFVAVDLLQINDVWIYDRPLTERVRFFWRFHDLFTPQMLVRNYKEFYSAIELIQVDRKTGIVIKSLNRPYCPVSTTGIIWWKSQPIIQARIGKVLGRTKQVVLQTQDYKMLFSLPDDMLEDEEWMDDLKGRIVDVDRDGRILGFRDDLIEANTWEEVSEEWDLSSPDELLNDEIKEGQFRRWPKSSIWEIEDEEHED